MNRQRDFRALDYRSVIAQGRSFQAIVDLAGEEFPDQRGNCNDSNGFARDIKGRALYAKNYAIRKAARIGHQQQPRILYPTASCQNKPRHHA